MKIITLGLNLLRLVFFIQTAEASGETGDAQRHKLIRVFTGLQ